LGDARLVDRRPRDGCYLIVYGDRDYFLKAIECVSHVFSGEATKSRFYYLTRHSLQNPWWLRWELKTTRFLLGEFDAVHHVCYCRGDLCNGDFEVVVEGGAAEIAERDVSASLVINS